MARKKKTTKEEVIVDEAVEETVTEEVTEVTPEEVPEEQPVVEEEPTTEVVEEKVITVGSTVTVTKISAKFKELIGKQGVVLEKNGGSILVEIDKKKFSITTKNVEA